MKNLFITIITVLGSVNLSAQAKYNFQTKFDDAIPVLNVGTFHMGYTTDANSTEFDEHYLGYSHQIQSYLHLAYIPCEKFPY